VAKKRRGGRGIREHSTGTLEISYMPLKRPRSGDEPNMAVGKRKCVEQDRMSSLSLKQLEEAANELSAHSLSTFSSVTSSCNTPRSTNTSCAGDEAESCLICLSSFHSGSKQIRVPIPCFNKCNKYPVHAECIYEWMESKSQRGESSCPLCRGPLKPIEFVPRDKLGSWRFRTDLTAKRLFISQPVPKGGGVARCFIRVVRNLTSNELGYELFLQAPSTLKYPLGPMPGLSSPKPGDTMLAVARKRSESTELACPFSQLEISMTNESSTQADEFIGSVYSSYHGLDHLVVAPKSVIEAHKEESKCSRALVEICAVRFTQNRIDRAVGPRRIHVCFPAVLKEMMTTMNSEVSHPEDGDEISSAAEEQWISHPVSNDAESLATILQQQVREQYSLSASTRKDVIFGENKTPYWLPAINAFSLDFGGRVTLPSNKNFQLLIDEENISLQFGKVAESNDCEVFSLDVAWPLSPLQAFGIALSSCDRKTLC